MCNEGPAATERFARKAGAGRFAKTQRPWYTAAQMRKYAAV